ncbi:hypothetical protein QRQ56_23465 [Bradyrhizobium sp. U531]|uniref:hypothetical protein n=1 Tax=Bradyrhizobium sp. U531 TaxID=3053458 RepID=UPI003F429CFA
MKNIAYAGRLDDGCRGPAKREFIEIGAAKVVPNVPLGEGIVRARRRLERHLEEIRISHGLAGGRTIGVTLAAYE